MTRGDESFCQFSTPGDGYANRLYTGDRYDSSKMMLFTARGRYNYILRTHPKGVRSRANN